nr:hypothetical protein [Lachnospiraceae bacterium]
MKIISLLKIAATLLMASSLTTLPAADICSVLAESTSGNESVSNDTHENEIHYEKIEYIDYDDDDDDDSSSSSSISDDSSSTGSDYSSASSSSSYIVPGATWFTPTAVHGENVIVVLPLVNMLKENVTDVVVTPVVSEQTDEFPFEIFSTGFTQKIDTLVGEKAEKDRNKRAQNCVWAFKTRDDVKSGYYKINYNVLYTNPEGNSESCTVSTYVKTEGLAKYGTTSGYEDPADKSTPRIIVTGF